MAGADFPASCRSSRVLTRFYSFLGSYEGSARVKFCIFGFMVSFDIVVVGLGREATCSSMIGWFSRASDVDN